MKNNNNIKKKKSWVNNNWQVLLFTIVTDDDLVYKPHSLNKYIQKYLQITTNNANNSDL